MSDEDFDLLVTRSSIYRHCQDEKASIARHQKRIEKAEHREIDFETALVDWMLNRRRSWLRERAQQA
ncbi:MAG: hypothetical protein ACI8XO_004381 [Verrucomicrobiales bacterium]|jgi:hypothetical protein